MIFLLQFVTDIFSEQHRSYVMSRVASKDTKPEKIVRSFLHRSGFRFRLHASSLQGKPDIVLPKHKTVIFVHGCFWHRHKNCKKATTPQSRKDFWKEKFKKNILRDKKTERHWRRRGGGFKLFGNASYRIPERDSNDCPT